MSWPGRAVMLAADLPWEMRSLSIWRDVHGIVHREPVVTRVATEAQANSIATQPGARVSRRP